MHALVPMRDGFGSVHRSVRLAKRTAELLDAAAAAGRESRNALANRLLGEAVLWNAPHPVGKVAAGLEADRRHGFLNDNIEEARPRCASYATG